MMVAALIRRAALQQQQPHRHRSLAKQMVVSHIQQLAPRLLFVSAERHTSSTVLTDYTLMTGQVNVIFRVTHNASELENGMRHPCNYNHELNYHKQVF
jgi:hypothetical protein